MTRIIKNCPNRWGIGSEEKLTGGKRVDEMSDMESPRDQRAPKQTAGIRSVPKADRVWGHERGGRPCHPERREVSQQGREVRTRAPSKLGGDLQIRRSLDSAVMVADGNICKFLTPSRSQMDGQTRRRRYICLRIWRGRPSMWLY